MGEPPIAGPPGGEPVRVEAYAGGRGEEEPRAVYIEGRKLAVRLVLERWREPVGRRFRIVMEDGARCVLLCREPELDWWLFR